MDSNPASRLLSRPSLIAKVLRDCPAKHVFQFLRLNSDARRSTKAILSKACDFNGLLRRFFSKPAAFRELMASTGAIIGGSQALQLLSNIRYPSSDLDVYVPLDSLDDFYHFAVVEGYEIVTVVGNKKHAPESDAELDSYSGQLGTVLTMKRARDRACVQFIVPVASLLGCIFRYHSSVVMNYIAWDHVMCTHPLATLVEKKNMVLRNRTVSEGVGHRKYVERGYESVYNWSQDMRHMFPLAARWVGDRHCWRIDLNTAGVRHEALPCAQSANEGGWEFEVNEDDRVEVHFEHVRHYFTMPSIAGISSFAP